MLVLYLKGITIKLKILNKRSYFKKCRKVKECAANIKHIPWWWSPLGNQCNGLLLLGMHCIKLVFESVKQILCRSMFHCEQALYLLLLELLEVVSICLHWKLMVTSVCKNDCSRTTGFCKKSICNQQLQLRTILDWTRRIFMLQLGIYFSDPL